MKIADTSFKLRSKMFWVFLIITFELVTVNSPYNDENTSSVVNVLKISKAVKFQCKILQILQVVSICEFSLVTVVI